MEDPKRARTCSNANSEPRLPRHILNYIFEMVEGLSHRDNMGCVFEDLLRDLDRHRCAKCWDTIELFFEGTSITIEPDYCLYMHDGQGNYFHDYACYCKSCALEGLESRTEFEWKDAWRSRVETFQAHMSGEKWYCFLRQDQMIKMDDDEFNFCDVERIGYSISNHNT